MRVAELWRYPVKSLGGERLRSCALGDGGIEGDRTHVIFDLETGYGLTARRRPELLFASASLDDDGSVRITGPAGAPLSTDDELSEWLGGPVALRGASDVEAGPRYENVIDPEHEAAGWNTFAGPAGPFHDSAGARLTLVSRGTIGGWAVGRFRPNVLLEGSGEDELIGRRAELGEASILVGEAVERCVMVTRPQPGGIGYDREVMRTIARERGNRLAVGASVERAGAVRVGDALRAL